MTKNSKAKSIISIILTICMLSTFIPAVYAAQSNEYVDPADSWLSSNNRTNELDVNATITNETQYCCVCRKNTSVMTYRVPEYTKSGETALNRGVRYSDGTLIDGDGTGNLDDGTPGIDSYYTGYHWTKAVCQTCGTINSGSGETEYGFNNNVYGLYSCDHNFFLEFDSSTYEPYSEDYHLTTLKRGEYCKFCKGTFARASQGLEEHDFIESVDAQLGNNRFFIAETCDTCGYETSEYVTAKSVVTSYYGTADGEAHTLSVSDLSDSGVRTSIRYGTTAEKCNKSSAPNYTQAGYYTVYYEIDYTYAGETMTENGVSYVWLIADEEESDTNGTIVVLPAVHEHEYHYLETVKPSCTELGYERFQCNGCGELDKRNYTPATGHDYDDIVIREATCKQGGLVLTLCKSCGDFHQTTTATGEHKYKAVNHNPTCRNVGYTDNICEVCGYNYITNITPIISHAYERVTKEPTCVDKGYTTSTCTMCGLNYVDDYTEATGHDWDEGTSVTSSTCESEGVIEHNCNNCDEKMIKATSANGHSAGADATCTTPQLCEDCGTVLENAHGHNYSAEVIEPTCTSMGYTINTCESCDDTYNSDYTDKAEHNYIADVTEPTCTSHGFTTYSCADCDAEYVSDYVEKSAHNYNAVVTAPTCTAMGFTTFTCEDCGDSYIGDYTDMTEHNYNKETVEPTCEEHGYAVYTCPDCGKSYIGDYTENKEHTYSETVIAPTCTEMGYTIFKCNDCDDEYKGNYTDKIPHDYSAEVTEATCTGLGYTTYTCECGDTYKADYKEPLGHSPSEWIVDTAATIENAGTKHIECTVCHTVLQTAELPQLIDKDNSDEDGNAEIGAYSIILTDENGKPIFNSELTIDVNDNVSINLTNGRLLDYEKPTTITAFYTDTQLPKENLNIFIVDANGNKATGATNADGQLIVPNSKTNTGDDNGTIGKDENDEKETFVITVTDKTNVIIPNCDIYIGESNNVVVDLPDGIKPTRENPVIVTITDHNGNPQSDVTVIALGDADFIEKGKTDIYGKLTLPTASDGYTDENGKVNVDELNVIVNDELGVIPNAYVQHNEDGSITVTLPDEKTISYANRITVTVLDSIGEAVKEKNVTVKDIAEATYTALTDDNGKIVVPPVNTDMTDSEGKAVVNGYNVVITDESKPIENAYIEMLDGKITVKLPDGVVIAIENRITATITDSENAPVKDMSVTFTDGTEKTETNLTDENGKATVPPTNIDYTDVNGYSEVDGYIVTVSDETKPIEKAFVTYNKEVKNEDETVKTAAYISVKLPENVLFDYANRITVKVLNKADNTPVKDMSVTGEETIADVEENTNGENSEQTEDGEDADEEADTQTPPVAKSLSGITDANGLVVFPPLNEDITDNDGNSNITDKNEQDGTDTDGDGKPDTPSTVVETKYAVSVKDTKGIIADAFVTVKDGKVYVTLPDTHTLTTSNQTTVSVKNENGEAVKNVSVTITDKTTSKSGTTNANGEVTLPVKSSGGGGGGSSSGGSSGGGGGGGSYYSTVNVKVTDKDGKSVSVSKSTSSDKVTLTLPTGKTLEDNNYTITVTDRNGKAKADFTVVLKDKNKNEATGKTNTEGVVSLPAVKHSAYIFGYPDGTFRADGDMSRAEAAAIFARLISEEKGEKISGKSSFKDVSSNEWYSSYVAYLEKYDVIKGYSDGTFRPNDSVSRAEFVAMSVRYYDIFNDVTKNSYTVNYTDVASSYWAYADIAYAKHIGWLNGYADGTFKGDNNITRAEVVTVVNRATGRKADDEYIKENYTKLNRFTDVTDSSKWYFADIHEAANEHDAIVSDDSETWVK